MYNRTAMESLKNIKFIPFTITLSMTLMFLNAAKVRVLSIEKCESTNNKTVLLENIGLDENGFNVTYNVLIGSNKVYVIMIVYKF